MQDPFLCDHERLRGLASEAVVRQGLACFKEQRIIELTVEPATPPDTGPRVIAHAQSTDGDRTYHVEVELDPTSEGDLLVDCDCGFADEPVCAHIIGTLLAYAARQPVSAAAERNAAEVAIAERAQRGRTEVDVRPLDGRGWPSTWAARSVATGRQTATEYRVEIRSVTERLNLCTCPDFAVNRLGTCKHIEAVLHRLSDRGRGRRKGRHIEPDRTLVHVDWSAAGEPESTGSASASRSCLCSLCRARATRSASAPSSSANGICSPTLLARTPPRMSSVCRSARWNWHWRPWSPRRPRARS